jgi:hypothetical protein
VVAQCSGGAHMAVQCSALTVEAAAIRSASVHQVTLHCTELKEWLWSTALHCSPLLMIINTAVHCSCRITCFHLNTALMM